MKVYLQKCFFAGVLSLFCLYAVAQDTTAKKWHFIAQPYLMFPTMDGKMGLGQLPDAEINAGTDEIFSHLQFAAMLYFEASYDRWAITSDVVYMSLKQDIQGKNGIVSGDAKAKQFIWENAGLRQLLPWFEAGLGLRLVSLKSELNMQVNSSVAGGAGVRNKSVTETWIDPLIIARVKVPAGKKLFFQVRGDLGGFGIGSDFTWQAQADVAYKFSKLFRAGIGYRYIGIDYEKGSGNERFLYDMDTFGPVLRFSFHF